MAEIHIGAEQFRRQLTDLLNRTSYGGDHIIIERHGTPLGALIPYALYEALIEANIPEKLAKLEQAEQNQEINDLAAALDAILGGESLSYPTAEERSAMLSPSSGEVLHEAAAAYATPELFASTTINSTLTLEEAAMYLKLPVNTVAQQADQGHLPGRKINDTWRFLRTAVDNWLRNTDGRQILLQQAGVFADDDSLAALRTQIYAERGRSETETAPAEALDADEQQ